VQVPFLDLKPPHLRLEEELVSVFRDCLRNASFIGGKYVTAFEEEFAKLCKAKYCIGVNSGTDALRFALMAAGVGPGDEVITVPNTFIATTEAISQTGASIAFVDIDERTYNLDPNKLEDYLKKRFKEQGSRPKGNTPNIHAPSSSDLEPLTFNLAAHRPKAVIPVHLYGQPADMDPILEIAGRYGLIVIEDACQAHGAQYFSKKENKWKMVGSMGLAAAFSFYPGKNLGACGEAGAVTMSNELIANKIRMIRDHGQAKKYYHDLEGYNGRLDAIQAGLLEIKLKSLPEWNEKRRRNAAHYAKLFQTLSPEPCSVIPPFVPEWARPVYHLYIARVTKREELQKYLQDNGIGTGLHYPVPLHLQKAYTGNGYKEGDFPITEKVSKEILSLPMFPELTEDQIKYVVETIRKFYA
jgi:dTDP-4-amino-4,6-dideoxygalactose transaminase